MKKVITLTLILVAFTLSGYTLFASEEIEKCHSADILFEEDSRATAVVVISNSAGGFNKIKETTHSLAEINKYEFGFKFQEDSHKAYLAYELCDVDMGTSIIPPILTKSKENLFLKADVQNYQLQTVAMPFIYSDAEGNRTKAIKLGGNYAVNVYLATDTEDWKLVDTLEFRVK